MAIYIKETYRNLKVPEDSVISVGQLEVDPAILEHTVAYLSLRQNGRQLQNHEIFADLRLHRPDPKISYESGQNLILKCENQL